MNERGPGILSVRRESYSCSQLWTLDTVTRWYLPVCRAVYSIYCLYVVTYDTNQS